jgi:hypothetical protein
MREAILHRREDESGKWYSVISYLVYKQRTSILKSYLYSKISINNHFSTHKKWKTNYSLKRIFPYPMLQLKQKRWIFCTDNATNVLPVIIKHSLSSFHTFVSITHTFFNFVLLCQTKLKGNKLIIFEFLLSENCKVCKLGRLEVKLILVFSRKNILKPLKLIFYTLLY